jgi:hypothetical protein
MLIATFGTTTGWAGKTITFDNGQYVLEGHGPITAQAVLEYDRQGHLTWANDGLREMVQQTASGQPAAPPTPTPLTAQPVSQGTSATPPPKKKRHGCLIALAAVAGLFILLVIVVAVAGTGEEAKVTPSGGGQPSAVPTAEPVQEPAVEEQPVEEPEDQGLSMGQQQAVESAQSYLDMGGFSRKALIEQLVFEDFSKAEAEFAVDYIGPDWNAQAAQSAQNYLDMGGFSRKSLIGQLRFEGFTQAQAEYGVNAAGY